MSDGAGAESHIPLHVTKRPLSQKYFLAVVHRPRFGCYSPVSAWQGLQGVDSGATGRRHRSKAHWRGLRQAEGA
jgi:hypothetical protein